MVDNHGNGTKFGRYVLLHKIGVGGMAEIYRAKTFGAAGFEKEFAIKLILPSLVGDQEFVEMFINEAKIAVSLYHANVVQVFDLGEIDGQYYIAMEYVRGKDLLEVLARCAERNLKLPLDLVLFIGMEMLKGLSFAHRASDPFGEELNIIHRDVSPSNILISYAGDVKVGDFGVAKARIQRTLTESGTLKGKVGYMSPEQVVGEAIDARSDIFAAGIVFFEALSMSRLFVGNSDLEVMLQVRDASIDERLKKAHPLPAGLVEIVRKALTKHKEERFQSSGEFYQALIDFSYKHGIKVTGSDLSNFMRRLFADEIEQEKAQLRAQPRRETRHQGDQPAHHQGDQPARDPQRAAAVARTLDAGRLGVGPNTGRPAASQPSAAPEDRTNAPAPPSKNPRGDQAGIDKAPNENSADADDSVQLKSHAPMTPVPDTPRDLGTDFYLAQGSISSGLEHQELPRDDSLGSPTGPDTARAKQPPRDDTVRMPQAQDTARTEAPGASAMMFSTVDEHSEQDAKIDAPTDASEHDDSSDLPDSSNYPDDLAERDIPNTIPFELISEAFHQSDLFGDSPLSSDTFDAAHTADDMTTAEFERVNQRDGGGLRDRYASYEGLLQHVPFARILAHLYRAEATGRLFVQSGSIEKSVYLRDGEPILIKSNRQSERLGDFLIRRQRITQAQVDEALARLDEWGGRLGDALVAIGAIEGGELFRLLSEQMLEKLLDVFTWPLGHYGYYENQEPNIMGYPLGIDTYSTIVTACRDHIPLELIQRYYQGREHVRIFRSTKHGVSVERLKLSARELRIVTDLEPGQNMQTLLAEVGEDRRELAMRCIYMLHQLGALRFETTEEVNLPRAEDSPDT